MLINNGFQGLALETVVLQRIFADTLTLHIAKAGLWNSDIGIGGYDIMSFNMTLNTGSPKGHPIKILLIDDDEMMRIFLRDIFWVHSKGDAYAVTATGSMKEAVSIIENAETRPDIVFLDLMLPAEDGVAGSSLQMERSIGLIKKLKNDPEFSKVKIVVFSGHKDTVIQNKIKDMGVAGYLVKGDFMPKEIISFVETIHK